MAMVLVWATKAMVWASMARGLLMLMPSLIPTTMVDTTAVWATMAMVWATTAMAMVWATMARGLLMLMPSLIPTTLVDTTVWATMARGLLMLMHRLIPTTMVDTMVMVWAMAMVFMDMDMAVDISGDKSSSQQRNLDIHQDLSVNHQLLCQQKNGLIQFEFHPSPVLPVSVLPA